MIISKNNFPDLSCFRKVITEMDILLNNEVKGREKYYKDRSGTQIEEDVFYALNRCAKQTPFEGTILLVSGSSFPDIVANNLYGIEVKSTIKNQWKSIGSSILESTRVKGVERIFLTFAKLGAPIEFRTKPYEECLSGISVTHYPRYQIDMELLKGETIFDKIGIEYDLLRTLSNPVQPVAEYYKSQLKPGESLWWADGSSIDSTSSPMTVRLWTTLSPDEKTYFTSLGYAFFPEIIGQSSSKKYHRYALWLVTQHGIVNTNIRDQFSAGGKVCLYNARNKTFDFYPASFGRILLYKHLISNHLYSVGETELKEYWGVNHIEDNKEYQLCDMLSHNIATNNTEREYYTNVFKSIFNNEVLIKN